MQKHSIVWVRKSRSRDRRKGRGLRHRHGLGHTLTFPPPLQMERKGLCGQGLSGREATCTTSPGLHHPMASALWGFHWLGRKGQKVGGTQRPVGTPETTCLTLQRALPHLRNLSLLFIQQVSWVQFNFAPISDCRFWVQSFLSIWFSLPLGPHSLFT